MCSILHVEDWASLVGYRTVDPGFWILGYLPAVSGPIQGSGWLTALVMGAHQSLQLGTLQNQRLPGPIGGQNSPQPIRGGGHISCLGDSLSQIIMKRRVKYK